MTRPRLFSFAVFALIVASSGVAAAQNPPAGAAREKLDALISFSHQWGLNEGP